MYSSSRRVLHVSKHLKNRPQHSQDFNSSTNRDAASSDNNNNNNNNNSYTSRIPTDGSPLTLDTRNNSYNVNYDSNNNNNGEGGNPEWVPAPLQGSTTSLLYAEDEELGHKEPILLDFNIRMRPIKQIFISYAFILLLIVIIWILFVIPSFAYPVSDYDLYFFAKQNYLTGSYIVDVLENSSYQAQDDGKDEVKGFLVNESVGEKQHLLWYASYAPCTVFKKLGCEYVLQDATGDNPISNLTEWVTSDMQNTMSVNLQQLINRASPYVITNCHYLRYQSEDDSRPLEDGDGETTSPFVNHSIVLQVDGRNGIPYTNDLTDFYVPQFFVEYDLRCTTDEYVQPMLNLTYYYYNSSSGSGSSEGDENRVEGIQVAIETYTNGTSNASVFEEALFTLANPNQWMWYDKGRYGTSCSPTTVERICQDHTATTTPRADNSTRAETVMHYVYSVEEAILKQCGPSSRQEEEGEEGNSKGSSETSAENSVVIILCQDLFYEPLASRFSSTTYKTGFFTMQFSSTSVIASINTVKIKGKGIPSRRESTGYIIPNVAPTAVFRLIAMAFSAVIFLLTIALCLIIPSQRIQMITAKNQIEVDASIAAEVLDRQERREEEERLAAAQQRLLQLYPPAVIDGTSAVPSSVNHTDPNFTDAPRNESDLAHNTRPYYDSERIHDDNTAFRPVSSHGSEVPPSATYLDRLPPFHRHSHHLLVIDPPNSEEESTYLSESTLHTVDSHVVVEVEGEGERAPPPPPQLEDSDLLQTAISLSTSIHPQSSSPSRPTGRPVPPWVGATAPLIEDTPPTSSTNRSPQSTPAVEPLSQYTAGRSSRAPPANESESIRLNSISTGSRHDRPQRVESVMQTENNETGNQLESEMASVSHSSSRHRNSRAHHTHLFQGADYYRNAYKHYFTYGPNERPVEETSDVDVPIDDPNSHSHEDRGGVPDSAVIRISDRNETEELDVEVDDSENNNTTDPHQYFTPISSNFHLLRQTATQLSNRSKKRRKKWKRNNNNSTQTSGFLVSQSRSYSLEERSLLPRTKKDLLDLYHSLSLDEQVLLSFTSLSFMDFYGTYRTHFLDRFISSSEGLRRNARAVAGEEALRHLCEITAALPSVLDTYGIRHRNPNGLPRLTAEGISFLSNLKFVRFRMTQVRRVHSLQILFRVMTILCGIFFIISYALELASVGDTLISPNSLIQLKEKRRTVSFDSSKFPYRLNYFYHYYYFSDKNSDGSDSVFPLKRNTSFSIFDLNNPTDCLTHLPLVQSLFIKTDLTNRSTSFFGEEFKYIRTLFMTLCPICVAFIVLLFLLHSCVIMRKKMW